MEKTYAEEDTTAIAQEVLSWLSPSETGATVLALQGDLGAGKTTLTKTIAKLLEVQETVVSPTFVIAKFYEPLRNAQGLRPFERIAHLDAYRIESIDELIPLGWEKIIQEPHTLVIVEWPERIAEALPVQTQYFAISHDGEQRTIKKL